MFTLKNATLITALCASLTGCYVVPLHQPAPNTVTTTYPQVPAQLPVLTARLYPTNDTAAAIGRISGTISRPEKGHGVFTLSAGTETFSGEATRAPNSSKGTANAAGNQGGYIKCEYTMTSSIVGTGTCVFSNGARYDMHITS